MGRKWNNIKLKKGLLDRQKSASFTKVLRDISIAVKRAGSDPDTNFALKISLQKAKEVLLPRENIDKAIKKASGEGMEEYFDVNYECYGVDGVAIFVEAATNNPTRTISNIRAALNRWYGTLGKEGCLQFVFENKSVFTIKKEKLSVDDITMELIDAGLEDVEEEDGFLTIKAPVENYGDIQKKLDELQIKIEESGFERLPLTMKSVDSKESYDKVLKLVDVLENDEDVRKVYHNMEYNEKFSDS
ncbi:MAG: YebC/PmpR family DNA-binding transcriptional regulator [Bacteriovoracaceae bacterium]|nr:YebC/PmpR family DNA-binding transcriptional regulator [Bacteriovoracaceae bacterium]